MGLEHFKNMLKHLAKHNMTGLSHDLHLLPNLSKPFF